MIFGLNNKLLILIGVSVLLGLMGYCIFSQRSDDLTGVWSWKVNASNSNIGEWILKENNGKVVGITRPKGYQERLLLGEISSDRKTVILQKYFIAVNPKLIQTIHSPKGLYLIESDFRRLSTVAPSLSHKNSIHLTIDFKNSQMKGIITRHKRLLSKGTTERTKIGNVFAQRISK